MFAAAAGPYLAIYGVDTTAPAISGLTVNPVGGSAAVTWTTSEAADARVDYGTAPDALTLTASAPGLASTHTITLNGLTSGTTYYYRVRSADGAGNATTSPNPPGPPASFTTSTPPSLNCPCSIWPTAPVPAVITEQDGSAVELGVKFRSTASGFITAIRRRRR